MTFEVDLRRPVSEEPPVPEEQPRPFELSQVYEARYTNFPRFYSARYALNLLQVFSLQPSFSQLYCLICFCFETHPPRFTSSWS